MEGIYDDYDDDLHNAPSISQLLLGVNLIAQNQLSLHYFKSGYCIKKLSRQLVGKVPQ